MTSGTALATSLGSYRLHMNHGTLFRYPQGFRVEVFRVKGFRVYGVQGLGFMGLRVYIYIGFGLYRVI